jgi:hypothetical protein
MHYWIKLEHMLLSTYYGLLEFTDFEGDAHKAETKKTALCDSRTLQLNHKAIEPHGGDPSVFVTWGVGARYPSVSILLQVSEANLKV